MNDKQWKAFVEYKEGLKALCETWQGVKQELMDLEERAYKADGKTPEYSLENPWVYNKAYDEITPQDDIKLIVIGDNPGKEEQFDKNQKYLVGQSGRIAEGFFRKNPEFEIDFRKNVVIMNKTPIHTAKTVHLKYLKKNGSDAVKQILDDSQLEMARMASKLHKELYENAAPGEKKCELWLVGYSELKEKGIFVPYREELKENYRSLDNNMHDAWNNVMVYQHFSMNRFLVDLKEYRNRTENAGLSIEDVLHIIGKIHRSEIFNA